MPRTTSPLLPPHSHDSTNASQLLHRQLSHHSHSFGGTSTPPTTSSTSSLAGGNGGGHTRQFSNNGIGSSHNGHYESHQQQQQQQYFGGSGHYGQQHGIDASQVSAGPVQTVGERMTCIVNASVTVISMEGKSHGDQRPEGSKKSQTRRGEWLSLYVFGGFHQYTDAVNNDLYKLDLDTMNWEKIIYTKGMPPSKRNDHSANLWGEDRIVIFGGSDETNEFLSDVHVLNVNTLTWESPKIQGMFVPEGRVKHAAIIVDDKLYVSGGCLQTEEGSTGTNSVSDGLMCLDLQTWEWQEIVSGFVPRYSHTVFVHDQKLFAYGGYNEEMDRTGVIAYLDLDSLEVTRINIGSDTAPNHAAQQFSQLVGRKLVVTIPQCMKFELQKYIGGIWTLDLDCFQWTRHDDWQRHGDSTWHYFAMKKDGEQFYLIGDDYEGEEYFKKVLTVDMREYGCCFMEPTSTMGSDFGKLLQDQIALADFRIYCKDDQHQQQQHHHPSDGEELFHGEGGMMTVARVATPGGDLDEGSMQIDTWQHQVPQQQQLQQLQQTQPSSTNNSRPGSSFGTRAQLSASPPCTHDPILCHKLILMARWPHFANMAQSGMIESQTSTMTIPENYETVRSFVDYLYTDTIQDDLCTDTVADLLVLAHLYLMTRLELLCRTVLHHRMDFETAAKIYHAAGLSGQIGLRQRALKFMFMNFGAVSKTEGFRALPKEVLLDFWDSTPDGSSINVS